MSKRIDLETPNVIAYEFDQKITKRDVKNVHDDLRKAIAETDDVRFFVDMANLESMEPTALIEDLKLTPEYTSEINRFAIVGDARWQKWLTKATTAFTQGEARFFSPQDVDEARTWIRN